MQVTGECFYSLGLDRDGAELWVGISNNLSLWHNGDNLISAVASVNSNTIIVAHSVGPSIIEQWIENPNVTAVCLIHFLLPAFHLTLTFSSSCYGPHFLDKKRAMRSSMSSMATTTHMPVLHTPSQRTPQTTQQALRLEVDLTILSAFLTLRAYLLIIDTSTL